MATVEMWTYTIDTPPTIDLTGFKVEAMDGDIGKVDEATNEVGSSFVIVDTGPVSYTHLTLPTNREV